MVVIVEDITELLKIKSEIERVYTTNEELCLSSPSFVLSSIKNFYEEDKDFSLFFVLNKHEEQIESYLPMYIDKNKTLRFIFDTHTDYCGVIGKKVNNNFLKDFAKIIKSDNRIKRLDFENLQLNDSLLNSLKYHLKLGACIYASNSHSYIYSSKEKGYFSSLKTKDRSELKRVLKKNANSAFFVFSYPQEFPYDAIVKLRDEMIADGHRTKDFLDSRFLSLIKEMYENDELIVIANAIEDKMVSVVFTFKNKTQKTFMFWITLYNQNVQYINLASYLNFITAVEFEDDYRIGFGRGDYAFKGTFSPKVENLYNLRYSKSKFDFYFTNYHPIKEFIKRLVKG